MNRFALVICSTVIAGTGAIALAGECPHSAVRELTLDGNGATRVRIDASAGSLKVVGRTGASDVRARGKACAPTESMLDDVRLVGRRVGDEIRITAEVPSSSFTFSFRSSPRLDFVVDLPPSLAVEVDDGSGDVQVARVASVAIEDGSGDLDVFDIAGDVRIVDGSGDVVVRDVRGSVRLSDGSGDIVVRRVARNVRVDCDGSGDLDFKTIGGNVLVESDGSGSIDVETVSGSFTVVDDGSGEIRFAAVKGTTRVPRRHRD